MIQRRFICPPNSLPAKEEYDPKTKQWTTIVSHELYNWHKRFTKTENRLYDAFCTHDILQGLHTVIHMSSEALTKASKHSKERHWWLVNSKQANNLLSEFASDLES